MEEVKETNKIENMFKELLENTQREYDALDMPIVCQDTYCEEKMLPMPDGVRLKTYIYRPSNWRETEEYSVILQRSPYFHAMASYDIHGRNLAQRGFIYILQFCRGTGASEGEWEPNVNERQDGLSTLGWLQGVPWVKNIGYWGDSYLALTGWCMADSVPDKVRGMYLGVYGTDRFTSAYCKGAFRHDVLTCWAMENAGFPVNADYLETCRYRPHYMVDEAVWGRKVPWYREWVTADQEENSYWQQGFWQMLRDIPTKVQIPLFITEGWYDHHLGSALKSYASLGEETGKHTTLRIGCWNHYSMNCLEEQEVHDLQNSEVSSMTAWFKTLLIEEKKPSPNVQVYVIGRDKWLTSPSWPLPVKKIKKWHLSSAGSLSEQPQTEKSSVSYIYDPENPTPSLGAESMLHSVELIGSKKQPLPNYRPDVKSFVSEPLTEDQVIAGKVRVKLQVASDCTDTAFTAKLMRVGEDGTTVNIRSSITSIRADHPKEEYTPGEMITIEIEMWDIVWELHSGERIRLDISSSDFPQYSIHSNYPGVWSKQAKTRTARQTIYCGGAEGSVLEVPLLEE